MCFRAGEKEVDFEGVIVRCARRDDEDFWCSGV